MEDVTQFDVMYTVANDVNNSWEARMLAQAALSRDLNHGPAYQIEVWDAECDSVQFRVTTDEIAEEFFHEADGFRKAA